jgi:hypothetical protein
MTAQADTQIGTGGSASSESTVKDPWHVDYTATGSSKVHNLLVIQTSIAGSLRDRGKKGSPVSSAGLGIKGSMGKLSAALDFSTGKLNVGIKLTPGWVPYVGVQFPKSAKKMKAPVAATTKELRKLLAGLLTAGKGGWKSKSPLMLTFVKDVGEGPGLADLSVDVFATQDAAGVSERQV